MSMDIIDKLRCINKGCPVSQEAAEDIRRLRARLAAAEARAELLEKELRQIYEWARVEKAQLRPGEIQSIKRALNESAALAEGEAG